MKATMKADTRLLQAAMWPQPAVDEARQAPTGQREAWAYAALCALDAPLAVLVVQAGRVLWASQAFVAALGEAIQEVDALCDRLQGLREALGTPCAAAGAGARPGVARVSVLRVGPRPLEASLQQLDARRLMLRVVDRAAEAQARQRHLEDREQLLFTSRMLSIGEMATTLAHEINQPIGAAANLLRGALMRLERPHVDNGPAPAVQAAVLQALQRAVDQVMFASKVVARIREYTHLHTPQRKPVEVCAVVRACTALLDWEIEREGVRVSFELPAASLWIDADELMLQQVLVNLMRNAIDAMRGNAAGQRLLALCVRPDGPQVEIVVRDSGSGISAQAEESLFTPFVSSKPTGTGIGLNICRSFIELHRGRLWFSRNADRGISFHASLPLKAQPHAGAFTDTTSKETS
jgi:two-component system, LuxR family, sensor kinase FixL